MGGGKGEGEKPNTQSGLFLKRAAAGGEENSKWHADLVPGPEGLQGGGVGYIQHDDLW